ncbi:MAG: serine hydrolase [Candidatus Calescibacterium sp.]|nr:class A beta-lactamase-related serine hydrolase [Candidatus Calescibacterium sp.]MCX7972327.1 class A beta-lactamase-related serine hydrolase [bacterium]MDW8195069.1 serine hydrolase [Candidatus Calescibacterium sp.]
MEKIIPPIVSCYPIKIALCITRSKETIFALNENEVFPAASLVKVPLALLILKKCQEKKFNLQDKIKVDNKVGGAGIIKDLSQEEYKLIDLITLSIVLSDNTASNTLINLTNLEEIEDFLKSLGLSKTCIKRKFMVDLINPPVNFTTASEMNTVFQKLIDFEILNSENTLLFLDILSKQQYREKIPLFLNNSCIVCNKTGDISGISHDAGVIFLDESIESSIRNGKYYILTVLTKFSEQVSRQLVNNIIGEISLNIYRWIGGNNYVHTYLGQTLQ